MPKAPKYSQSQLEEAIRAVQNGASPFWAANNWGVPRSTLKGRIQGRQPADKAHYKQQRLSQEQEAELTSWIRCQNLLGAAPTHSQIRTLATRMLEANNDYEPLGKRWVISFLARNKPIKSLQTAPSDSAEAKGATSVVNDEAHDSEVPISSPEINPSE